MYDNNDNNSNSTNKFNNQKRVYKLMVNLADGNTKQVGFLNIDPQYVKTPSFFSKIEQEIDKAMASGAIKFSGAFSLEANDKGANAITEDNVAW